MNRRNFIKRTCFSCAGAIGATWFLQACTSQKYVTNYQVKENKIIIKKSDFTIIKKDKTIQQKFILIKPENITFPIALYKIDENNYKALYLECTHQGCELTPHETAMVCPCHGAEFNNKGEVTQGPAENNLKTFETTNDNENIYIKL